MEREAHREAAYAAAAAGPATCSARPVALQLHRPLRHCSRCRETAATAYPALCNGSFLPAVLSFYRRGLLSTSAPFASKDRHMLHPGYPVMLMRGGANVIGRVCLASSAYIRWELKKGNGYKAHNGLLATTSSHQRATRKRRRVHRTGRTMQSTTGKNNTRKEKRSQDPTPHPHPPRPPRQSTRHPASPRTPVRARWSGKQQTEPCSHDHCVAR